MNGLAHVNLIRFLDFYFMLMFAVSLIRRFSLYREVAGLVVSGPARWPRLLVVIKGHHTVFLTWATILPALLALFLAILQLVASREIWPHAQLSVSELGEHWAAIPIVLPLGAAMLAVDLYCAFMIGKFDRALMEKYFDQAEFWLRSHTAHVVRIVTFGFINPRRTVNDEVLKALHQANQLVQMSLWWMTVQVGVRVAFGLALWGTWVILGSAG